MSQTNDLINRYLEQVSERIKLAENAKDSEQTADYLEMLRQDQKTLGEIKSILDKITEQREYNAQEDRNLVCISKLFSSIL